MLELRRILFPVDFSERCSAAASHVAATARQFHAKVTLLHVVRTARVWQDDPASAELDAHINFPQLTNERQVALDSYLKDQFVDLAGIERIVRFGEPARVIVVHAHNERSDLIMMPTHSYSPFRRLLGSITARVFHDAECPVWTDVHDEISFARLGCQSVLCAVDRRQEMVPAIRWAAAYAASWRAKLTLMHAIPVLTDPARVSLMETAHRFIADLQQQAGISAAVCIEGGKIAMAVREAALQHTADLIVIGQGRIHQTFGRLRSNGAAIIREAPCPVVRV